MLTHNGTQMLETDRLILRRFAYSDDDDMLRYWVADEKIQSLYSEPTYETKEAVKGLLDKYIGSWENGKSEGQGTYIFSSGSRYSGHFHRGKADGYGTYTWENGNKYEGNWKNDKRNGYGKLTTTDGEVYEGEWYNDNFVG